MSGLKLKAGYGSKLLLLALLTAFSLTFSLSCGILGADSPTSTPAPAKSPVPSPTSTVIPTATLPPLLPTPLVTQVTSLTPGADQARATATPIFVDPDQTPSSLPPGDWAGTYTVQAGDTLYGIALELGVSMEDLISANDIEDRSQIRTGQVLVIPGEDTEESTDATATPTSSSLPDATATPLPDIAPTVIAGATTHTVESGESLYGIALLYGVSYTDLAVLNEIADPSHIWVGQVLKIPQEGQIIATPTPQPAQPTATPTSSPAPSEPTATPTPSGPVYQFNYEGQTTSANCGLTAINGYVRDAFSNGLSGYRLLIGSNTGDWVIDPPADTNAEGKFEVPLRNEAFANTWWIYVIDGAGTQISPRIVVTTTDTNCEPKAGGAQVIFVTFKQIS